MQLGTYGHNCRWLCNMNIRYQEAIMATCGAEECQKQTVKNFPHISPQSVHEKNSSIAGG